MSQQPGVAASGSGVVTSYPSARSKRIIGPCKPLLVTPSGRCSKLTVFPPLWPFSNSRLSRSLFVNAI